MRRITGSAVAAVLAATMLAACAGAGNDDAESSAAQPGDEAAAAEEAAGAPVDAGEPAQGRDDSASAADGSAGGDAAEQSSEAAAGEITGVDLAQRHIIYHVDLLIETDDIERATQRAGTIATTAGGFVADEHTRVDDEEGEASATLTLRVPSSDHLGIVERLEELGEVLERGRSADDVTEEVVDVESRIESQRRSIDRIRQLLGRASDIDDVVRIESELARREAELDSLLQRQATLSDLTSLATVTVTFRQEGGEQQDESDEPSFLSGLSAGWRAFVGTVTVAGAVAGAALPFVVAAGVLAVPAWLVWRRRRPVSPASPGSPADLPGTTGS